MDELISSITPNKGNVDGNISHLRDTFLEAEREYVLELLKSEGVRSLITEINEFTPEKLFAISKKLVDDIELGLVPDDQMELMEQRLTVMLAAIQDKQLIKELTFRYSGGRNR